MSVALTEVIKVWEILHVKDVGEIGFCDLVSAMEEVGIKIINDIPGHQPMQKVET